MHKCLNQLKTSDFMRNNTKHILRNALKAIVKKNALKCILIKIHFACN